MLILYFVYYLDISFKIESHEEKNIWFHGSNLRRGHQSTLHIHNLENSEFENLRSFFYYFFCVDPIRILLSFLQAKTDESTNSDDSKFFFSFFQKQRLKGQHSQRQPISVPKFVWRKRRRKTWPPRRKPIFNLILYLLLFLAEAKQEDDSTASTASVNSRVRLGDILSEAAVASQKVGTKNWIFT